MDIKTLVLDQMKDISKEAEIDERFICLGRIDVLYPELPAHVLECYRTWIWEWFDGSFRMATVDYGNGQCAYLCEGIPNELIKHLNPQAVNE